MGRRRVGASPAPRFDGLTPSSARASRIKKAVGRRDTRAEVALHAALRALGLRFRKNVAALPGRPDIVLTKQLVVVFVDGDFWHGRHWPARRKRLAEGSNPAYWIAKIEANMARDRRTTRALRSLGWKVVRVWERDVLSYPDRAARRVSRATDAPSSAVAGSR